MTDYAQSFGNKVAFVTGAAGGIGRATALAFAAQGASVAAVDLSDEGLNETVAQIAAAGGKAVAIRCDIAVPEEVEAAIDRTVETFGRLDFAFNNAGVENKPAKVADMSLEEWDRIVDINLRGTFVCMKHQIAQMLKQGGGAIVNNSSGAGIKAVPNGSNYVASKHGVIGLTKTAAIDYADAKIRVNAVLPGNIQTSMMDRFTGGDLDIAISQEPVGRLGKPEEIAAAVLWMCSDLGAFVTGATISVDGGWSL